MSPYIRTYLMQSIAGNARVFAHLLNDLPADDARWDARVDPERFTLREIVAHLTDFDAVMRERFERMIREDHPELPNWDEDAAAAHYSTRDPQHGLASLLESRETLGAWLEGLSDDEWRRDGSRPGVGKFSVEEGAALLLAHDAYHLQQVTAWLDATA